MRTRTFTALLLPIALCIQSVAGLGCMNAICAANPDTKLKDCDPESESLCGQYKGKRFNNAHLEAIDVPCPVKERIFSPIDGILSYEMPFGGNPRQSCADQAARIDGTGQWQGFSVLLTTVILTKYGGAVSAGEMIGYAGNMECALDSNQQSDTNYIQMQLLREGRPVDPTHHFANCMCTGKVCETNNNNLLVGGFKSDSRYNGVKGFELVCTLAEEDDEFTDDIKTRAPIIYSPIEGKVIGRKRLTFDEANQRYEGCENEGLFIEGTNKWTDFSVSIYNVRYREDIGFGRKHIVQGQPIGYRLTCPKAPNSIFLEVRFQGTVVNITDQLTAKNCQAPHFDILF